MTVSADDAALSHFRDHASFADPAAADVEQLRFTVPMVKVHDVVRELSAAVGTERLPGPDRRLTSAATSAFSFPSQLPGKDSNLDLRDPESRVLPVRRLGNVIRAMNCSEPGVLPVTPPHCWQPGVGRSMAIAPAHNVEAVRRQGLEP